MQDVAVGIGRACHLVTPDVPEISPPCRALSSDDFPQHNAKAVYVGLVCHPACEAQGKQLSDEAKFAF